jgi:hypothetical protein
MIAWALSIAIFIAWCRAGIPDSSYLLASGLFAIAGSITMGLDKIARKG